MATYNATPNAQGQLEVRKQYSVLSKSLMIAGIGFILMYAFSMVLFEILKYTLKDGKNDNILTILYVVSIVLIISTLVMSLFTMRGIEKTKLSSLITMIFMYGIGNGISFGILFYAISLSQSTIGMTDVMLCFLITGFIFGVVGSLGTLLSVKFTMTLGKFLMYATLAFLVAFLVLSILSFTTPLITNKISLLIWAVWGVLIIGYIMYDFSIIKKSQSFVEMLDQQSQTKYVWLFGFMLFMNLIQLLWLVLRVMLATRR
ncbi:MAG: hypothetical protein Ta2E_04670 [Mycoplasmoidaceae bacterium]|nr:MAG: hypothetical protein Ta2E_04670 [Mycoplasmoidaceae bacterium]